MTPINNSFESPVPVSVFRKVFTVNQPHYFHLCDQLNEGTSNCRNPILNNLRIMIQNNNIPAREVTSSSRTGAEKVNYSLLSPRGGGIAVKRLALVSLLFLQGVSAAWGGSDEDSDSTMFGNSMSRDWLSSSSSIAMQFEGCSWGYVASNDDAGCMEQSSQDGTTYWYQMANCRRAQAVFSLYATSSGSASCSKSTFKESVSQRILKQTISCYD